MYSTRLKRKLAGQRRGFDPNGEQKSSWMNPPSPFTLIAKKIIRSHTDSASANVVLTVGRGNDAEAVSRGSPKSPMNHAMMSTGRKSMEFISNTHTNTVSARGAMNLWRSPWKMPFTESSMKSKQSSTNAWRFVARRSWRLGDPPEEPRHRSRDDETHEQRIEVERHEVALRPPSSKRRSGGARCNPGGSDTRRPIDALSLPFTFVGYRAPRSPPQNRDRDHETGEKSDVHDVLVIREHDREQDEDKGDLDRFRPEDSPGVPPLPSLKLPRATMNA
jgi:hypothetical protein